MPGENARICAFRGRSRPSENEIVQRSVRRVGTMPRMSVNRAKSILKENDYFYGNEILPEFRARQKAALKELESVPEDGPNEVGMQTINPKTEVGKYFVEFSSGSTIHGLNHLVAPHRHPVEK